MGTWLERTSSNNKKVNAMITYKTSGDKIKVQVPFEIKDLFKQDFKTARWNSAQKVWEINNTKQSENKLIKFIELASPAMAAISAVEEDEYTADKIDELERELGKIKEAAERRSLELKESGATLENLKTLGDKVNKMNEEQNAIKKEIKEKEDEVKKIIDEALAPHNAKSLIIDLKSLGRRGVGRDVKEAFHSVQDDLAKAYYDIKEKTGISINTLKTMSTLNFNRKDRDNPEKEAEKLYKDIEFS